MRSDIFYKVNKVRIISSLRTVTNGRVVLKKIMATSIRNQMLGLRVKKLDQWEALWAARNDQSSMPDWISEML